MKPLEQIFGATTTKPSLDDIFKGKLNAIKKKQEKESFWSGVKSDITDRSEKLGEIADAYGSGEQGKAESAFQTAGQAIGGLWDVAGRGISAITPDFIEKPITEGLGKLAQTAPVQSLVQGWENIKENNPRLARNLEASGAVASVLPVEKAVMTGIKGATKGAEKGAEIIGRTGKKISTATGEAATFATSKLTGLNPSTIKTILSAPKALSAAEKAGLDRVTLGGRVKSALDERIDALSDRGKAYTAIRESGATVDIDESVFKGLLDKYKIKTDGAKVIIDKESLPLKQTEVNDLERFMDMFGNEKSLSANAFMNARSALADMAKYGTDKSSAFISLVREMRHELNKNRVKIPGLKEIDEFFASEKSTLKQLRKDYINPATGELKDNALSKIANLTGAGKDKVLNRLEKLVPGIREEINILKALEDIEASKGIKVGTYTSAGISGAIALSGNILGALLSLLLSSPGVAVPIIKAFGIAKGVSKQTIDNIINKMKTGGKMTADQIEIIDQAVRDYSAKIEDNIKKAQPGLTIKDVSKDLASPEASLIQEAKKYKSAEEFVKKQKTLFHGSDQRNIDAMNKNGVRILSPEEKLKLPSTGGGNVGISMTTDAETARNYSGAFGNKNIGEFYINPNAKVKKISTYIDDTYTPAQLEKLQKEGYDLITSTAEESEVRILSDNAVKTKSQLEDIWKKANSGQSLK